MGDIVDIKAAISLSFRLIETLLSKEVRNATHRKTSLFSLRSTRGGVTDLFGGGTGFLGEVTLEKLSRDLETLSRDLEMLSRDLETLRRGDLLTLARGDATDSCDDDVTVSRDTSSHQLVERRRTGSSLTSTDCLLSSENKFIYQIRS